jgi:hypothetical protein
LQAQTNSNSPFTFDGFVLADLNEHTAIHYHNKCIPYLMQSADSSSIASKGETLAAATILRFYEQIDSKLFESLPMGLLDSNDYHAAPLVGCDSETYMNIVQVVINPYKDKLSLTLDAMEDPPSGLGEFMPLASTIHYSASLIALRQEIWSVILYRRPFQLPLSINNDYNNFSPADEYVWANRIHFWVAEILVFCFGTTQPASQNEVNTRKSRNDQWDALSLFLDEWDEFTPPCFAPLYYRPSDLSDGRVFPQFFFPNGCQVLGLQAIELGRMLLAAYNPRRQLSGLGARAATRAVEATMRQSVLQMCGLTSSNAAYQCTKVTATLGVSLGGEAFYDPREQEALLEFVRSVREEHVWPVQACMDALQKAWREQD